MSDMKIIGDAELNAYLDGELDSESQAVVAAWLAKNPEEAVRLELMRRDKDLLANINSDILSAPVPAALHKNDCPDADPRQQTIITGCGRRRRLCCCWQAPLAAGSHMSRSSPRKSLRKRVLLTRR